jgi:AcrR family transcriptional regulator
MATGVTDRDRAKADRHRSLVREASRLFAQRGFAGVSLEELGAAVGVSGPAVYRHFANKQALLAEILIGVSRRLLEGGTAVVATADDASTQVEALVDFHIDFALADADVIRVQDRDLASLSPDDRRTVRELQRTYVEVWTGVLDRLHAGRSGDEQRMRALACLALINSTPHSVHAVRGSVDPSQMHAVLRDMALAALQV